MKYDDAEFYFLNFTTDLPNEAGAIPMGMFVAWTIERNLCAEDHGDEDDVRPVRERRMTGAQYVIEVLDGKLLDSDLNDEGNAFAGWYYGERYLADYCAVFGVDDRTDGAFTVPDTWESYAAIAAVLDRRYEQWRRLPRVSKPVPLSAAEAFAQFTAALGARLSRQGFTLQERHDGVGAPFSLTLSRVYGRTVQRVILQTLRRDDGIGIRIMVDLVCDSVAQCWKALFAQRRDALDARLWQDVADFSMHGRYLAERDTARGMLMQSAPTLGNGSSDMRLDQWIAEFERWFFDEALPRLDTADTIRGLAALVVTERYLELIRRDGYLHPRQLYSCLILCAAIERVPLGTALRLLRENEALNGACRDWRNVAGLFDEVTRYIGSDDFRTQTSRFQRM